MRDLGKSCFVCGCQDLISSKSYFKCTNCGHEVIGTQESQAFIINDVLSKEMVERLDALDRFKRQMLNKCAVRHDFLLDIGSGSGKFLYHNGRLFTKCMGIEITDKCVDFARNQLKLSVENELPKVVDPISIVTFWHSLEHMPSDTIEDVLKQISSQSSSETRVIVSVPNSDSLQYALFREGYAYYDPSSHIHQFTARSLNILMDKYGFEKLSSFFSFPYSSFGYVQGLINKFNRIHNYLYYRNKRGDSFNKNKVELWLLDVYNLLLLTIFLMPSLLLTIVDCFSPNKGGVITVCYGKKKN